MSNEKLSKDFLDSSDNIIRINDCDLKLRQYPMEVLAKNFCNVKTSRVLAYQKLDADFCKNYILNEDYMCVEETYLLDINYVLSKQPHLKEEDFYE